MIFFILFEKFDNPNMFINKYTTKFLFYFPRYLIKDKKNGMNKLVRKVTIALGVIDKTEVFTIKYHDIRFSPL